MRMICARVFSGVADASMPNVRLAAKVRPSAPACLRRVERLKEAGLIRRVVALLEPAALDAGMLVVIGFVLDRSTPEAFAAFEKTAQKVSGLHGMSRRHRRVR
jgi:DNA-binding Lrp family transcriptional regulator